MATGNVKNFELKIGKTGLFVVIAGMATLLCAAFLFGVDMGQNIDTYPEKIASLPQRALALVWRPARIKMAQQVEIQKSSEAHKNEEKMDLDYHEALTSKKGMPKDDSFIEKKPVIAFPKVEDAQKGNFHIETKPQTVAEKEPVKQKVTVKDKETSKQKESVKEKETAKKKETLKEKPTVQKNEDSGQIAPVTKKDTAEQQIVVVKENEVSKAQPDTGETQPPKDKFIIQVASMKDKSKAYQINKKIASLGFQSKIIKTQVKGKGVMFCVIASGLNGKENAQDAANKISAKTGTNCIVKKIDNKSSENN